MQLIYMLFPLIFTLIIFTLIMIIQINDKNYSIKNFSICLIYLFFSIIVNFFFMVGIERISGDDVEIWSGRIIEIQHKEEWDEWIPPKIETYTTTDKNGKQVTHTRTIPGYWKHHYAENLIKTSDDGWKNVYASSDRKVKFNDNYPNTESELNEYYPVGQPTSSFHSYQNKLNFSKSLFKARDVDKTLIEQLPDYPSKVNSDFTIDRLLGEFKNKDSLNDLLNEWNSKLNMEPLNKQVNVIYVNVGDLPIEYGYALESKWEGANKNDFVISFSMVDNKIKWVYPFSWTEVEILKINIRDYMLDNSESDFSKIINDTCNMIAEDFERKEMEDYKYIKYQHGMESYITSFIVCLITLVLSIYIFNNYK